MSNSENNFSDSKLKDKAEKSISDFEDDIDIITDNEKSRRKYMGFTYFLDEKETAMTPQNYINATFVKLHLLSITKKVTISRVENFCFQLEISPKTKSRHIHVALCIDSSTDFRCYKPILNIFRNSYIIALKTTNSYKNWCEYCIKEKSRYPGTEPKFYNIDSEKYSQIKYGASNYVEPPISTPEDKQMIEETKILNQVIKEELKKDIRKKYLEEKKEKLLKEEIKQYKINNNITEETKSQCFKRFQPNEDEDEYSYYPNIDNYDSIQRYEKHIEYYNISKKFHEKMFSQYEKDRKDYENLMINEIENDGIVKHLNNRYFLIRKYDYSLDELPKLKNILDNPDNDTKIIYENSIEIKKLDTTTKVETNAEKIMNLIFKDNPDKLKDHKERYSLKLNPDIDTHDKEPIPKENTFDALASNSTTKEETVEEQPKTKKKTKKNTNN